MNRRRQIKQARARLDRVRVLAPWAESELADFERSYSGCTCFISPPCGSCVHPGNPSNLEDTDDAWRYVWRRKAAECTR